MVFTGMGRENMKYKFLIKYKSEAYIEIEDDDVEEARSKADDIVFEKGIDSLHQDFAEYEFIEIKEIPSWVI